MNKKNWLITLDECPHCGQDINIQSTSTKSLKSCIESIIKTSKLHINDCRKKLPSKICNRRIKETEEISEWSSSSTWKTDKILL